MAIHNPASENVDYCSGSNSATWYINNNQVISFAAVNLSNGTSYTKQNISGQTKIIWDGNKEHIINNPSNYSYSIIFSGLFVNYSFRYRTQARTFLSTNIFADELNNCFLYVKTINNSFWLASNRGDVVALSNELGSDYHSFQINSYTTNRLYGYIYRGIPTPSSNVLRIVDNGIIYLYRITNTNSVQVVTTSSDNAEFTFTAGNRNVKTINKSDSIVSLKCGIDCPPETCFKCRNGSQVCCYSSNGKVIDIIDDPNQEIEGAC